MPDRGLRRAGKGPGGRYPIKTEKCEADSMRAVVVEQWGGPEAHEIGEQGRTTGKIVLSVA
ncbi:hypothetical protein GCM10010304_40430 [Streptomyces roseoviolaceus]